MKKCQIWDSIWKNGFTQITRRSNILSHVTVVNSNILTPEKILNPVLFLKLNNELFPGFQKYQLQIDRSISLSL